jgi:hypothetical protein
MDNFIDLTPTKRYSNGVAVANSLCCVLCYNECKDKGSKRYTILDGDGNKGSVFDLVESLLNVKFSLTRENFGTFTCAKCQREVVKADGYRKKLQSIKDQVNENGQALHEVFVHKRIKPTRIRTPSKSGSKLHKRSVPGFSPSPSGKKKILKEHAAPSSKKVHSKKQLSFSEPGEQLPMNFEPLQTSSPHPCTFSPSSNNISVSMMMSATPLSHQSSEKPPKAVKNAHVQTPRSKAEMTIKFRTNKIRNKMKPLVQSLKNGAVRDTLKLIHKQYPEYSKAHICNVVNKECIELAKYENSQVLRDNSAEDLTKTDLKKARQAIEKNCPLSWAIVCKIASGIHRSYQFRQGCVLTAFLMLMNSRSQRINRFQMASAISLYKYDISKEGIDYLSTTGLTVSHTQLHTKLKEVEDVIASAALKNMKEGIENNMVSRFYYKLLCIKEPPYNTGRGKVGYWEIKSKNKSKLVNLPHSPLFKTT